MHLSAVHRRACQTRTRLALNQWQRGWALAHQREAWRAKEEALRQEQGLLLKVHDPTPDPDPDPDPDSNPIP